MITYRVLKALGVKENKDKEKEKEKDKDKPKRIRRESTSSGKIMINQ
jgi:hypothetical protein